MCSLQLPSFSSRLANFPFSAHNIFLAALTASRKVQKKLRFWSLRKFHFHIDSKKSCCTSPFPFHQVTKKPTYSHSLLVDHIYFAASPMLTEEEECCISPPRVTFHPPKHNNKKNSLGNLISGHFKGHFLRYKAQY